METLEALVELSNRLANLKQRVTWARGRLSLPSCPNTVLFFAVSDNRHD